MIGGTAGAESDETHEAGGEFSLTPEAPTIADLCSITVIRHVNEQAEKLAEWFGLNAREVNWVRTAKAGNDEDGYSEALLGIDGEGWFPLRVRASPYEAGVIDNSDSEQTEGTITAQSQDTLGFHTSLSRADDGLTKDDN